jgi:hypothetical protein
VGASIEVAEEAPSIYHRNHSGKSVENPFSEKGFSVKA